MYLLSTVSIHGHSSPYLNFNETDFYNIGISMISILMIDISKIFAGWISSWEENDLGGFCLGRKWLKVWVDFGGWKMARWILDGWISSPRAKKLLIFCRIRI